MTDPAPAEGAGRVLATAREEAERFGHAQIGTEHLLLALLRERESLSPDAAALLPKDAENAEKRLMGAGKRGAAPEDGLALSSRARRIMDEAAAEAGRQGGSAITPDHLLTALLGETKGIAAAILREASGKKKGERPPRPGQGAQAADGDAAAEPARGGRERRQQPEPKAQGDDAGGKSGRGDRQGRGRGRDRQAPPKAEPAPERPERRQGSRARGDGSTRPPAAAPPLAEEPPPRRVAPVVGDPFRIRLRHLLLPAVPAVIWLAREGAAPSLVFALACLAILPLAQYLGEATEHLAERTGSPSGQDSWSWSRRPSSGASWATCC